MASILTQVNGHNNDVLSELAPTVYHSGHPSRQTLVLVTSSYNTQLLTHYGYYLSPKPTIQQLKKHRQS